MDDDYISAKYEHALADQYKHMEEVRRNEMLVLPEDLDYSR